MRFAPEQLIFGIHFTFNVFSGKELYTQPLLANNNQPDKISFNKFSSVVPIHFGPKPKEDKLAYQLTDQNGYCYYNQYPGVRRDIPEQEGDNRFNLGVEYPWYLSIVDQLPRNTQYEYHELTHFLNKCIRGITEITARVEAEPDPVLKKKAFTKGREITVLYQRVLKEFSESYKDFKIVITHQPEQGRHIAEIVPINVEDSWLTKARAMTPECVLEILHDLDRLDIDLTADTRLGIHTGPGDSFNICFSVCDKNMDYLWKRTFIMFPDITGLVAAASWLKLINGNYDYAALDTKVLIEIVREVEDELTEKQ